MMVIKKCKICGKEFDATGRALCCSPECRKINKLNNVKAYNKTDKGKAIHNRANRKYNKTDKGKATRKRYKQSDKGKASAKKYWLSDKNKACQKKYNQSDKGKATRRKYQQSDEYKIKQKEYRQSDRGRELQRKRNKKYRRKKIAELSKKFDGDLQSILKECPGHWMKREAIMQVKYGKSYEEAMYKKMQTTPVCEVTGESGDLVIHHLDSFNLYPEKGADLDNLVRVKREIHDDFHSIYGRGNNTREQWFEFLEKNRNIYI